MVTYCTLYYWNNFYVCISVVLMTVVGIIEVSLTSVMEQELHLCLYWGSLLMVLLEEDDYGEKNSIFFSFGI